MTNQYQNGIISAVESRKEKTAIGFLNLIKGKKKHNALVFVDYEHWHVSIYKNFASRPAVKAWKTELDKKYNVVDMFFFGDFSNHGMRYDIPKIREVTNNVIETQNTSQHYKKDFTDFIMLDSIYQHAMSSKNIDTFIIFTGDGHFTSVVKFLTNVCKKEVVVYAVRDCLSGMLKSAATNYEEIPSAKDIEASRMAIVAQYMIQQQKAKSTRRYMTFLSTMEAVSEKYGVDAEELREVMTKMLQNGYLRQERKFLHGGKQLKAIYLETEKLLSDGIELEASEEKAPQAEKRTRNRK